MTSGRVARAVSANYHSRFQLASHRPGFAPVLTCSELLRIQSGGVSLLASSGDVSQGLSPSRLSSSLFRFKYFRSPGNA